MNKNILVTGGAGYIGSHTVHLLIERGYNVSVIDSLENGHTEAVHKMAKMYIGRIGNQDLVDKIIQENSIKHVINFAGYIVVSESVKKPLKYFNNNLQETLSFLNICLNRGVETFVFSSSAAVYGYPEKIPIEETSSKNPINAYGASKLAFEYILESISKAHDLNCVALRYFNAAGAGFGIGEDHNPETHLIPIILNTAMGKRKVLKLFGTDYNTPDGTCIRDYIHVLDLAEAHILAIEKNVTGFNAYNLGNGTGYSVKEIVDEAQNITKKDIPILEAPRRPGDPDKLVANPGKARKQLDFKTNFTLTDIIESAWEWHLKKPNGFKIN